MVRVVLLFFHTAWNVELIHNQLEKFTSLFCIHSFEESLLSPYSISATFKNIFCLYPLPPVNTHVGSSYLKKQQHQKSNHLLELNTLPISNVV